MEVKLEDYWSTRRIPRASDRRVARPVVAESTLPTVNERAHTEFEKKEDEVEDEDEEEDPEFTLGFRLPGCMRGWVVFGPRVPRSRKSWPALPGRNAEKETGRKRLLAVRFNVFADTELVSPSSPSSSKESTRSVHSLLFSLLRSIRLDTRPRDDQTKLAGRRTRARTTCRLTRRWST